MHTIHEAEGQRADLFVSSVFAWVGADTRVTVDIIRVLGEGGFSFVYLARDEHSGVSSAVM